MAYFVDEYVVTAAAEAAALVRRLVPAGPVNPWTALATPVDGNWQEVMAITAMQLEAGNSGTTNRQAWLGTLEVMGSPRVSMSLLRVKTGLIGYTRQLTWIPPFPYICSGVAWFCHHHGLVENDVVRLKVHYTRMKGVNYETW